MNKPSNNVFLQGIWQPLTEEYTLENCVVLGTLPKELNGTFYRNGPNPHYLYSAKNYHMYEGDGMIHAISFNHGKVSYLNRWVRTEKFLLEEKAKKGLFGGLRDFAACDPSVQNCSRNTANTNILLHNNNLLALNEAHQPIAIKPDDLSTLGTFNFNNTLDRSMTAHPKTDPITGELLFYSYFSMNLDFMYFIAHKKGNITYQEKLTMPYISMMHDFAITKNYSIFPVFPLTWDLRRIMRKEYIFQWEPNLGTHFGIMPRYGNDETMIWFQDDACLAMHVVNAYEKGDNIILDMMVLNDIPENAIAFADNNQIFPVYLTRWIFNLTTRKLSKQNLDNVSSEFPRIDERFTSQQHHHAYMASTLNNNLIEFDSITHYDLQQDIKQIHRFGNKIMPHEPIFVPRSKNSKQGEGFLLTYVYHTTQDRSDLVILDAEHVDHEPVAIVQLPHRIPYGFHGCWVSQE